MELPTQWPGYFQVQRYSDIKYQVLRYSDIKYISIACFQVEYILIFTEDFLQRWL